ncbi:MAG: DNA polymerase III subunit gamma/tau, partial [Elusimicrobiota bacterium]|nr:DNA polymerase III subunit gamma/tau [Elusimicrobiota bacterium]
MQKKSYQVLARKYRPMRFDDVIGQEHISQTLKNAISETRIANAYLFSGPRGCGKTTMARIFAKALNCKNGPTVEPCGKCDNCIEIGKSMSLDVIELDGASNRGINEIKDLMENTRFAPANSKYKIYIIDEAHQITKDAFNALLKTLEEPPEHVVFIMATTEQHKFPVTILSRCQRYRFKLLSAKEMTKVIKNIAKEENFEIDDAALDIVINASGGSMRDALSLLDQVISSGSGKITGAYIRELLGFLPKELIASITESLAKGDMPEILKTVNTITQDGYDILQFAKDLRDHLRQIMIYNISPEILDISQEDKQILENQKSLFTTARYLRMNNLISKALEEMHWHDQPRILLEMYLLKMAESYYDINALLKRIGELEKSFGADGIDNRDENDRIDLDNKVSVKPASAQINHPAHKINEPPMDLWNNIISEIKSKEMTATLLYSIKAKISDSNIVLYAENDYLFGFAEKFKDKIAELFKLKTGKTAIITIVLENSSQSA